MHPERSVAGPSGDPKLGDPVRRIHVADSEPGASDQMIQDASNA